MNEWYYAKGGQQSGPVTFDQLAALARSGGLDPAKDLVWTSTMKDWQPAGQVEGLFTSSAVTSSAPVAVPAADPANPYAAPQSSWVAPAAAQGSSLAEIVPGSEPFDPVACIKRGFDLTKRHFANILLVGVVYVGISMGLGVIQSLLDMIFIQGSPAGMAEFGGESRNLPTGGSVVYLVVSRVVSQVVSLFLSLGLTRVALNFVSGGDVSVGQLFGEGHKLLRAIGASILFGVMVLLGMLLLVVPGVYLALRYGQYMVAIVDRDLGVMEAFSYSSSITTNNRLNLFLLGLLSILVMLAGLIACGVGLIFAGPVVWLTSIVAYRWMQYGTRAAMDQPGTTLPMLASR